VESELLIESFSWNLLGFVKILNLPFLVGSTVIAPNNNGLTFFIFSTCNIKDLLIVPIDKLSSLIIEELPPYRVGAPDLHVFGFS